MRRVLIVAFHFPPESSSSGVLRTAKFARYLVDLGWRVTVLTIQTSAYAVTDESLLSGMPDSVRIIRTRYIELRKIFAIRGKYPSALIVPDAWLGWMPFAVRSGLAATAEGRPDVVLSTSPHPTAHLIGQRIARRLSIPSVVDFRDPWYEDPPEPGTPALVQWFARRLERRVVLRASRIVASTSSLRELMCRRYASVPPDRFVAIANGYDEEDFVNLHVADRGTGEALVILHAGSINGEFRDPRPLFNALGRLLRTGKARAGEFLVQFAGPGAYASSTEVARSLAENGIADMVRFMPRVKYSESLNLMANADLLLLLQASEDTTTLVPAKLYEYMRARRPVLALTLPGATPEVLNETGGGWSCNPVDSPALDSLLDTILTRWRSGRLRGDFASPERLARFERRALTSQLSRTLLEAVGSST